jgi:hypothetical protein
MSLHEDLDSGTTLRPKSRTRPGAAAFVALLLLVAAVAWSVPQTGVSSESSDDTSMPLGWIPIITLHPPLVTVFPIDPLLVVTIPDAHLSEALHARCGVPTSEPLHRGDLYALTGSLDLSDRGIADLEGVQYCRQILVLNASENPLSTLPVMTSMTSLQQLYLDDCEFTAIPDGIASIPNLVVLVASRNRLTVLPEFIAALPDLRVLYVNGNEIREIPASYGSGNLEALFVQQNRISSIPDGLVASPHLKTLYAGLNRLTRLPDAMAGKSWHELDFEFNFLDVSVGSDARILLESLSTSECRFDRQLTPIRDLSADATDERIHLTWTACPDADDGTYSSTVARYLVYRNEGGVLTELAILDKSTPVYTETGLDPETERTYTVGVEYVVVDSLLTGTTRHYVSLTTSTTDRTATPEATASVPASITTTISATTGPSPASPSDPPVEPTEGITPKPQGGGLLSWVPVWILVLVGILGLAGIVGVTLRVIRSKSRS